YNSKYKESEQNRILIFRKQVYSLFMIYSLFLAYLLNVIEN
ncbi:hypothetical protein CGSSp9BS68_00222, partial [Streptococcus pneumoniae SP9-BS68]